MTKRILCTINPPPNSKSYLSFALAFFHYPPLSLAIQRLTNPQSQSQVNLIRHTFFLINPPNYLPSFDKMSSAQNIKREPPQKTRRARGSEADLFEDDDDEETRLAMEDAEGIPIYTDGELLIRQVKEPALVNRKLEQLYKLIKRGYIELNPEYQRDVVWDSKRSSGLIGSILAGYFIPPIIFNLQKRLGDEHLFRVCVDGKQRLTSICRFMDGEIPFEDNSSPPKKWYFCNPTVNGIVKSTSHLILPPKTRHVFLNRAFCCYEFMELPVSVEETMFQLVQRGMPLTPAEKMRAMSTPWANFCKLYEIDYPLVLSLNPNNRAAGFRMVVTICAEIMEVDHPSGDGSRPRFVISPQALIKLLQADKLLTEKSKHTFKKVFEKFTELVEECSFPSDGSVSGRAIRPNTCFAQTPDHLSAQGQHHVKTFSPLEVLSTAILIHVHQGQRNNEMLKGDIMDMRLFLRENHNDLRLNTICWASAWGYINDQIFIRRGGEGVARSFIDGRSRAIRAGRHGNEDENVDMAVASAPARKKTVDSSSKAAPLTVQAASSTRQGATPVAPVAPMISTTSSRTDSNGNRSNDSLFIEDEDPVPDRRRMMPQVNDARRGTPVATAASDMAVDVKPSISDLSITPTIQPRKRLQHGGRKSLHNTKRPRPSPPV